MKQAWTNVADVIALLRKRWDSGRYLSDYAAAVAWEPISVPLKAPTAGELLDRFDEVVSWAARFSRDSASSRGCRPRFRIEYRVIQGRNVGANSVPYRVWIDRFEDLSALLGTTGAVRQLDRILEATRTRLPTLMPWITSRPLDALAFAAECRDDIVAEALALTDLKTFCPYKGIASYYDIDGANNAAWSYRAPLDEMSAIGDLISFEPDRVEVTLDGDRLELEPGAERRLPWHRSQPRYRRGRRTDGRPRRSFLT